jgi:predicted lysophospholipase L1 biosynthesis ABC-type transport system permease subunit
MRVYRERLGVPLWWWLLSTGCVLLLGTTLWAGLSVTIAVFIYVALEAVCAAVLLGWGAATIEITGPELRAGSQRLPLAQIARAAPLDAAQTRALRGPRADPAAYLMIRPYLPESVYVEITGRPPERPYWLIATRKPDELAATIERARPAIQPAGDTDGDPVNEPASDAVG